MCIMSVLIVTLCLLFYACNLGEAIKLSFSKRHGCCTLPPVWEVEHFRRRQSRQYDKRQVTYTAYIRRGTELKERRGDTKHKRRRRRRPDAIVDKNGAVTRGGGDEQWRGGWRRGTQTAVFSCVVFPFTFCFCTGHRNNNNNTTMLNHAPK